MQKLVKVEAKEMIDIREKVLQYIIIGEGSNKVVINVGEKTYKSVSELLENTARPTLKEGEQK